MHKLVRDLVTCCSHRSLCHSRNVGYVTPEIVFFVILNHIDWTNVSHAILNLIPKTKSLVGDSASFLAELSVSSPRKIFIFIIKKYIFWIKVSKKIVYFILKKEALSHRRLGDKQVFGALFE